MFWIHCLIQSNVLVEGNWKIIQKKRRLALLTWSGVKLRLWYIIEQHLDFSFGNQWLRWKMITRRHNKAMVTDKLLTWSDAFVIARLWCELQRGEIKNIRFLKMKGHLFWKYPGFYFLQMMLLMVGKQLIFLALKQLMFSWGL